MLTFPWLVDQKFTWDRFQLIDQIVHACHKEGQQFQQDPTKQTHC